MYVMMYVLHDNDIDRDGDYFGGDSPYEDQEDLDLGRGMAIKRR